MSDDPPQADVPDAEIPAGDAPEADRRSSSDRRKGERRTADVPVKVERRTKQRRQAPRRKRSMNQYDLEAETLEFINAINRFKESSGRAFPTWSEVLGILKKLGYEKRE